MDTVGLVSMSVGMAVEMITHEQRWQRKGGRSTAVRAFPRSLG